MTEASENNDHKKHKELTWQNEADSELNSSEWFGALIRYFWHLGKKKFDTIYTPKELKKNVIIGWLFKMVLLITFFYVMYLFMNPE